jgi:predicted metal-dependent hydrolase
MLGLFSRRRTPPAAAAGPTTLVVEGQTALVRRKPMRTLRMRLRPPDGILEVSAPLRVPERAIRAFIADRLTWIQAQRAAMAADAARPRPQYLDGDPLRLLDRTLTLKLAPGKLARARLQGDSILLLSAPPGATRLRRQEAVQRCLGRALLAAAEELLPRRQAAMGVQARRLKVRAMRSRWGSCGIRTGTITLALELSQRPAESLEYVLVHELAHLIVRSHGKRFKSIMDGQMPDWRLRRKALNSNPIGA